MAYCFYRNTVHSLTLCKKASCSQCNCSHISKIWSDLPRLITVLSALSIIWGEKDIDVDVLGFSVFLHASLIDFYTADTTVWYQRKTR